MMYLLRMGKHARYQPIRWSRHQQLGTMTEVTVSRLRSLPRSVNRSVWSARLVIGTTSFASGSTTVRDWHTPSAIADCRLRLADINTIDARPMAQKARLELYQA